MENCSEDVETNLVEHTEEEDMENQFQVLFEEETGNQD